MAITAVAGGQAKVFYDGRASGSAFGILDKSYNVVFHTPVGGDVAGTFNKIKHSVFAASTAFSVTMTSGNTSATITFGDPSMSVEAVAVQNDASILVGLYVADGTTVYRIDAASAYQDTDGSIVATVTLDRAATSSSGTFEGYTGVIEFVADVGNDTGVGYMTIRDASTHELIGSVAVSVVPTTDTSAASPVLMG